MADAKLTALTAASALAAADLFYVSQSAASRKATGTQLLALVGTAYVPLAGGTMTGALTIASGTLTASAPALSITQTWTTGAAFTGAVMNITDTSSAAGSLLQDWQVAGVSKASIAKNGLVTAAFGIFGSLTGTGSSINYFNAGIRSISAGEVAWTSGNMNGTMDLALYRDAAATLAQRNGTTQQIFRLYNSYTDSSNFERLTLTGVAGTSVNITAETLGTGGDNLNIVLTPAGTGTVLHPLGTYGTPGIGFVGYPNTGIYTSNGTSMGFSFGSAVGVLMSTTRLGLAVGVLLGWNQGSAGQYADDIALARNAAGVLEVNSGTAGAWRDLKLRNLLAGGGNGSYVQTPSMTVANLAAAATAGAGARAFVTDANATTFLSTVAAGGANKVPVVSDGTNWLIG